ncbi:MAG TPA: hypothetical protein VL995_18010 [Cellvibrio sp.]|nr:hypothetical protein [Cellvibrio sp.]
MNKLIRNIGVTLFSIISASTYAKTFKYELTDILSSNGTITYPNLDFDQAQSAVFTVNKDPLSPNLQITSLEVTFPTAAKLVATGFKQVDHDTYRAVVNDAWIYRQIFVDVHGVDFNYPNRSTPRIEASISEKSIFIQPEADVTGQPLFFLHSPFMRDITPSKIADTASVVLAGKRLTLSLKNNLGVASNTNGPSPINQEGFVVDALWMGKGQKTLYIPAPVPVEEFDRFDAIAIDINELPTSQGVEYTLVIKFKDLNGYETSTPELPLMHLLEAAYGQQP